MDRNSLKWDWTSSGSLQSALLSPLLVVSLELVITSIVASMPMGKVVKAASCCHRLANASSRVPQAFLEILFFMYFYFIFMDSYKYRCSTIGHKSPTWLIHPHQPLKNIPKKPFPDPTKLQIN